MFGREVSALVFAAAVGVLLVLLVMVGLTRVAERRELRAMTADRDSLVQIGERICDTAGKPLKAPKRSDWGIACYDKVVELRSFRTDASDQTNQILIDTQKTQLAKMQADLAAARRDKSLAFAALDALKEAAADVPATNAVGADYYRALNRTAGLRDAPLTDPAA